MPTDSGEKYEGAKETSYQLEMTNIFLKVGNKNTPHVNNAVLDR